MEREWCETGREIKRYKKERKIGREMGGGGGGGGGDEEEKG